MLTSCPYNNPVLIIVNVLKRKREGLHTSQKQKETARSRCSPIGRQVAVPYNTHLVPGNSFCFGIYTLLKSADIRTRFLKK
jgi:hypothetical protein